MTIVICPSAENVTIAVSTTAMFVSMQNVLCTLQNQYKRIIFKSVVQSFATNNKVVKLQDS